MEEAAVPVLVAFGIVAFIALVVVLIVFSVRRERERKARIEQWAASRGWTVTQRPGDFEWISQLPGRTRRRVSLLVSGTLNGRPVGVAEYSYTTTSSTSTGTGTGSSTSTSTTTHHLIVTVVGLDAAYPPVAVQPRGALSRLGRTIFGDNAAATGHDEFDRQFRVQTKDPAYSRTLVGPALIGEHLAGRAPAWSLAGQDLLMWQQGRISDPSQIEAAAAQLVRVADLLGR
jgi:hypothetical protein